MKKVILLTILIIALLSGCKKKQEELIKIADLGNYSLLISTPSNFIYIASGSEIIPYIKDGEHKKLYDYWRK